MSAANIAFAQSPPGIGRKRPSLPGQLPGDRASAVPLQLPQMRPVRWIKPIPNPVSGAVMSLAKYEFLLKATRSLCFSVDVSSEVVALSPRSYSHKWSDGLIHIDGDTVISYSFEPVGLQLVCSGDQLPMSKSLALACDVAYALASFQGEPVEVLSLEAPPDFDEDLPESQIVSINTLDLPPKIELFMRAMEHKDEMSFCDGCGTPIVFTPIGSGEDAIRHFCSCGRYVGTLRR